MAIKGYFAFRKVPALLEPHHQIVLCHILDIRCGSVTHLQRCTWCIRQLHILEAPWNWFGQVQCLIIMAFQAAWVIRCQSRLFRRIIVVIIHSCEDKEVHTFPKFLIKRNNMIGTPKWSNIFGFNFHYETKQSYLDFIRYQCRDSDCNVLINASAFSLPLKNNLPTLMCAWVNRQEMKN